MGPARFSRRLNCSATKKWEDKRDEKLLKYHGIICAAQLKIRKLTRREIVENTKGDWIIRDPTISHNNSNYTMHLCPFTKCEFQGNKMQMRLHKLQSHPTIMPYKCEAPGCKYTSNQHGQLLSHLKHSHRIMPPQFVCTFIGCDFKANHKPFYKIHLIKAHDEKPYVCVQCQKGFKSTNQLKNHTKTHFEDRISCKFPNCEYKHLPCQSAGFKIHMLTHTQEKPHKCPHCDWRARRAHHLKLHLQLHEDPSTRAKFRIYRCDFEGCSYSSNQNSHLKNHMTTHSKDKPFNCSWPKCNFATRLKSNLIHHTNTHCKDKLYICNFCNTAYTTNGRLIIHMRSHTGEKPYKCSYQNCKYSTAEPGDVKNHEKARHSEEIRKRNFTCVFCQNSFLEKSALESHMRTHTGERPYSCQYCTRDFTEKASTNVHERLCKMRPDGKVIKPFDCQFCERAFVTTNSKRLHEMCCKMRDDGEVIKPHKCQYCSKKFTWRESLKCHEMCCSCRPDGIIIKPFKCSFQNCKFAATYRSNLKRHEKNHLLVQ